MNLIVKIVEVVQVMVCRWQSAGQLRRKVRPAVFLRREGAKSIALGRLCYAEVRAAPTKA